MMTPDSLSAAVAGCISASVTEVFFTGGEPTLHPGLVSAAADLKAGGIKRVVVLTNGVLLTDDLALKLKTAGVDEVRVSIDGVTTDTNDPIRGHKTFTQAIDALARLRRLNIRSAIVFTACKPNIADWQALPEFAAAHADQLYAGEIIYFGRAHEYDRQLALSAEQVADFRAIIARAQASPEPGVTINSSDSIGEYRRGMCAAGRSKCTIAWDGNVIPCSLFDQPEMCAGNLHEDSLPSLWASAAPFQRLRGISAVMIGQCRGCRYRLICGGGCRAKSFVLHGDPVGKPCPTDCLWRTIYFDRMVAEYGAGATEFIGSGAFK